MAKKPNTFIKGMASDMDAHAIPSSNYQEATNARLVTRDADLFSIKNIPGMKEMPVIATSGIKIKQAGNFFRGHIDLTTGFRFISSITATITYTDSTTSAGTFNIDTHEQRLVTNKAGVLVSQSFVRQYTNNEYMGFLFQAIQNTNLNSYYSTTLNVPSSSNDGTNSEIVLVPTQLNKVFQNVAIEYAWSVDEEGADLFTERESFFKVGSSGTFIATTGVDSPIVNENNSLAAGENSTFFGNIQFRGGGRVEANVNIVEGSSYTLTTKAVNFASDGSEEIKFNLNNTDTDVTISTGYNSGSSITDNLATVTDTLTAATSGTGYPTNKLRIRSGAGNNFNLYFIQLTELGQTSRTLTTSTYYTTESFAHSYKIVGLEEFSDFLCAFAHSSENNDAIFKIEFDTTGSMTSQTPLILGDFGLTETKSIRTEAIEENENFKRVYFTDGVTPLKMLNITGDSSYYASLSQEGLNLVRNAALKTPSVVSVLNGGNLPCGSYSYCYRLMTKDGKFSSVSPISNPTPVYRTSKSLSESHQILGGRLNENSGKSISIFIENLDTTFDRIQLIALKYISKEGAVIPSIIQDTRIFNTTITLSHTGAETEITTTLFEVLAKKNTWDTCKDIAIKDNRLFAANLQNTSLELGLTKDTFRVKSYAGHSSNDTYVTHSDFNNPNLLDDDLYFHVDESTQANNKFRYIKPYSEDGSSALTTQSTTFPAVLGAETENFGDSSTTNGVRVTFKLKQFTLDSNPNTYYRASATTNSIDHAISPFYGVSNKTGEDGFFDNYKNPIFSQKFKGYMRGEIYRFAIQFYDRQGEPTFAYPIGDIRMPDINAKYAELRGNEVFTNDGNASHGGSNSAVQTDSTLPKRYILEDENGKGYILFPEFRIKLSDTVKKNISGFSIVRVERTTENSTIQFSGILNETINFKDSSDLPAAVRNHYGNSFSPLVSLKQDDDTLTPFQSDIVHTRLFTIDSPDILFGTNEYIYNTNDDIKTCGLLNAFIESNPIVTSSNNFIQSNGTNTNYFGGRYKINGAGTDTNTMAFTFYSKYHLDGGIGAAQSSALTTASRYAADSSDNTYSVYQSLHLAEIVGVSAVVPISELSGVSKPYTNGTATGNLTEIGLLRKEVSGGSNSSAIDGANGFLLESYSKNMDGNTTLLVNIQSGNDGIQAVDFGANDSDFLTTGQNFHAQKLLVKIYRRLNASTLYGGNTDTAFENAKYISTGSDFFDLTSIEPQSIASSGTDTYLVECFGGDTYVCLYGLSKHVNPSLASATDYKYGQAVVFPVETRINLDLRQGDFFGAPQNAANQRTEQRTITEFDLSTREFRERNFDVELASDVTAGLIIQTDDDFIYNPTYSSVNNLRNYLQKPTTFVEVNEFKNVVAASNLKLAGDLEDSFSRFDANEFFEVDMSQGPIFNIFNFKNELFVIQKDAIGKLSVNPRGLLTTDSGAVQLAAGTGNIIVKIDYLDTKFGSQHFNNGVVTNKGLYWFDDNQSAFCVLQFTNKGALVTDILQTTNNSNLLFNLRNTQINDSPLIVGENLTDQLGNSFITQANKTSNVGGVHMYNNQLFNEIGLCITGLNTTPDFLNIIYDERLGVISSKRSYKTILSSPFNGRLYSIGYQGVAGNLSRKNLFLHDESTVFNTFYDKLADDNFKVKFVCNEEVFTTKVFDKLIMYLTGNQNSAKLTKFTFTDSLGNVEILDNTQQGQLLTHAKMRMGKHIVPIRSNSSTTRLKGDFLTIEAECNTTAEEIEIFSALTHYRKMLL